MIASLVQKAIEVLKMQEYLKREMNRLKYLLDKKGIKHIDSLFSFSGTIFENISFIKDGHKYTVSRRIYKEINSNSIELIRVDKVSSNSEEYGYFKQIHNLPLSNNCQNTDLVSFNGDYKVDNDENYLSSLSILF